MASACDILSQQLQEELNTIRTTLQNLSLRGIDVGNILISLLSSAAKFAIEFLEKSLEDFLSSVITDIENVVGDMLDSVLLNPLKAILITLGNVLSVGGIYILIIGGLFDKRQYSAQLAAFIDLLKNYQGILREVASLITHLQKNYESINYTYFLNLANQAKRLLDEAILLYSSSNVDSATYNEATNMVIQARTLCLQGASKLLHVPYSELDKYSTDRDMSLYWSDVKAEIVETAKGDSKEALKHLASYGKGKLLKRLKNSLIEDARQVLKTKYGSNLEAIAIYSRKLSEAAGKISTSSLDLFVALEAANLIKVYAEQLKDWPYKILAEIAKEPAKLADSILESIIKTTEKVIKSRYDFNIFEDVLKSTIDKGTYEVSVGLKFYAAYNLLKPYDGFAQYSTWDNLAFDAINYTSFQKSITNVVQIVLESFGFVLEILRVLSADKPAEKNKALAKINSYLNAIDSHIQSLMEAKSIVDIIVEAKNEIVEQLIEFTNVKNEQSIEHVLQLIDNISTYAAIGATAVASIAAAVECVNKLRSPASYEIDPSKRTKSANILGKIYGKIDAAKSAISIPESEALAQLQAKIQQVSALKDIV